MGVQVETPPPVLWAYHAGQQSGVVNMATDDSLLDWLIDQPPNTWVVHTYQWAPATLSVGVHQRPESIAEAYQHCPPGVPIVPRPTGGRAIYHDGDTSFAVITNAPSVMAGTLAERYDELSRPLYQALNNLGVNMGVNPKAGQNEYAAHPLCFASHTPWDIVLPGTGEKLAGCAQCVRRHGILQHGAAFLTKLPVAVGYAKFVTCLQQALEEQLHTPARPLELAVLAPLFDEKQERCQQESDRLLRRVHVVESAT